MPPWTYVERPQGWIGRQGDRAGPDQPRAARRPYAVRCSGSAGPAYASRLTVCPYAASPFSQPTLQGPSASGLHLPLSTLSTLLLLRSPTPASSLYFYSICSAFLLPRVGLLSAVAFFSPICSLFHHHRLLDCHSFIRSRWSICDRRSLSSGDPRMNLPRRLLSGVDH